MLSCPCGEARIGAFLLTFALAWLYRTGIAPMFASLMHGDIDAVLWALLAGLSVVLILYGIAAALTHDDAFRLESFIWSVGVIVFCAYALLHHWTAFDAVAGDYTGTFWLAWIASNAVNIWLQLRGSLGRIRSAAAIRGFAEPQLPTLRRRHRVRAEWLEEFESYGIDAGHALPPGIGAALPGLLHDFVEHDGVWPQIPYVKRGDAFVPIPDAMPVDRRRR